MSEKQEKILVRNYGGKFHTKRSGRTEYRRFIAKKAVKLGSGRAKVWDHVNRVVLFPCHFPSVACVCLPN